MVPGKSALERAFEIAASGDVASLKELEKALRAEFYDAAEVAMAGRSLRRQLLDLIAGARARRWQVLR
jgi:hypothetical protein